MILNSGLFCVYHHLKQQSPLPRLISATFVSTVHPHQFFSELQRQIRHIQAGSSNFWNASSAWQLSVFSSHSRSKAHMSRWCAPGRLPKALVKLRVLRGVLLPAASDCGCPAKFLPHRKLAMWAKQQAARADVADDRPDDWGEEERFIIHCCLMIGLMIEVRKSILSLCHLKTLAAEWLFLCGRETAGGKEWWNTKDFFHACANEARGDVCVSVCARACLWIWGRECVNVREKGKREGRVEAHACKRIWLRLSAGVLCLHTITIGISCYTQMPTCTYRRDITAHRYMLCADDCVCVNTHSRVCASVGLYAYHLWFVYRFQPPYLSASGPFLSKQWM